MESPEIGANFISRWTLWWMRDLLHIGWKKPIQKENLYKLLEDRTAQSLIPIFEDYWNKELKKSNPSLLNAIWQCYKYNLLKVMCITMFTAVVNMLNLSSIGLLIDWFSNNEILGIYNDKRDGFILVGITSVLLMFNVLGYFISLLQLEYIGFKIRTQCTTLLYKKLLRLNSSSEESASVGKIVNIVSNDVSRINEVIILLGIASQFPIFLAFTIYQVYSRMGIAVLATLGGIVLFFLFMIWQAVKIGSYREQIAPSTDARCKATEELVAAISIVKMYCWESSFLEKIIKHRRQEIALIKRRNYLGHAMHRVITSSGKIMSIMTFAVHFSLTSIEEFRSSDLFVVQSFIEELNWQLGILFWTIFTISEGIVSMNRIEEVLKLDERQILSLTHIEHNQKSKVDLNSKSIILKHVNANWPQGPAENVLKSKSSNSPKSRNSIRPTSSMNDANHSFFSNLNLEVDQAEFLGVIGPVGSGKTSFLSMFLNEMNLTGEYNWNNRIAYCPQESWIFIGSIRENILVGRTFDRQRFEDVTRACCLISDFQNFPDKDQTVVGERGVTLSGGQRARINLARAIYGDAEIYLLDDPLAAVDTKVAQSIFKNVFVEYLKSKTRILVTHHVDLLQGADRIICFNLAAKIVFNGEYSQLHKSSDPFLKSFMDKKTATKKQPEKTQVTKIDDSYLQTEKGVDMDKEEKNTGKLGMSFFINYFLMCGSKMLVIVWILFSLLTQGLQVLTDLQMASLGNAGDELASVCNSTNMTSCSLTVLESVTVMNEFYIFIGLFAIWLLVNIVTVLQYVNITMQASQNIHDVSIASVIKTSMDFFHTNPTGRVMNRFTKDMGVVDDILIGDADEVIFCITVLMGILIVNFITMWFSFVAVIPLIIIVFVIRQYYVETTREVKRLEGVQQSPLFSHFSETINGRVSINAFNITDYMLEKTYQKQNDHGAAWIIFVQLGRWLQLRLDFITSIFFIVLSLTFVIISDMDDIIRLLALTTATIGLSLSKSWLIIGNTQWLIKKSCDCENNLTSLERILEYSLMQDEEGSNNANSKTDKPVFNRKNAKQNIDQIIHRKDEKTEIIQDGRIELKSFCYGYKNNVTVLNNISIKILSGEKIGIVGRTGAGKSSLISALFRMRKPQSGTVIISTKDAITDMSLLELRRNLSIIPQEPFIFCDTFRRNIDPLGESNDEKLWSVLCNVGLADKVKSCTGGLDYSLVERGANLSVGEKQLLCLARATLKHNKILLIDEATANVDMQTDEFIQQTLTKVFDQATVITVAHRLKTIIHSDRVIVMEQGKVVEFDTPKRMLQDENSFFKSLVDSSRDSSELYGALGMSGTQF